MSQYKITFDENIKRVDSLCSLYEIVKTSDSSDRGKEYKYTDMLRAALIFLHSSFEEYYRSVITEWLFLRADKNALDELSLPKDAGKRNAKFSMKDLLEYKDLTVSDIFQQSIENLMHDTSFNSFSQIASWASKIKISLNTFKEQDVIEAAVQRRHKIVHEADLDPDSKRLKGITSNDLKRYKDAYVNLVEIIDNNLSFWESETDNIN